MHPVLCALHVVLCTIYGVLSLAPNPKLETSLISFFFPSHALLDFIAGNQTDSQSHRR
jgi:hypothetical protein